MDAAGTPPRPQPPGLGEEVLTGDELLEAHFLGSLDWPAAHMRMAADPHDAGRMVLRCEHCGVGTTYDVETPRATVVRLGTDFLARHRACPPPRVS